MMKYYLAVVLLLSAYIIGDAQIIQPPLPYFNLLGVQNGLPEGSVHALLQDKYGYMWIGTQNGLVKYDGYKTKVYQIAERRSNMDVKRIYEDKQGGLWIGTIGSGLFYYDRSNDKLLNYLPEKQTKNLDASFSIRDITDDKRGNLWLVMYDRITKEISIHSFNTATHHFTIYGNNAKGNHYINASQFFSFASDTSGNVLIGSNNGFYQYDAKHDRFVPFLATEDSTQQRSIYIISNDKTNAHLLWMAAGKAVNNVIQNEALIRYNLITGESRFFTHLPQDARSLASNSIETIYNDKEGNVWIGTDSGLSKLDTRTEQFTNYAPSDPFEGVVFKEVGEIVPDNKGNLWLASNDGLLYFNTKNKTFTRHTYSFKSNNGIAGSSVHNLLIDQSGVLWFGTEQLGLQWLNTSRSKFTLYQANPGTVHYFPGGAVNSFAEAADGTFWLSSEYGLYHWNPLTDSFTFIHLDRFGTKNLSASSVMVDREGLVWCREYGNNGATQGIYVYNPQNKQVKNYLPVENDSTTLSSSNVRVFYQDHTGIIWVGTFGEGICSFSKTTGKFTRYPYINNTSDINREAINKGVLDDDQVQSIYEDKEGTLWVGTNNGSINRFDRQTNRFLPYQQPVHGMNCVMSIYNDDKGKLWVGTYMDGLYALNTKQNTAEKIYDTDGLLYNGGWGIKQDSRGNLWLVSPRGFTFLQPGGGIKRVLTSANGLPSEPVAFGLYKSRDGHFLYVTKYWFAVFNPNYFAHDTLPPVVHIENITLTEEASGKTYDSTITAFGKNEVDLRYNENRITLTYIGLHYQDASLTTYHYKLSGYDKEWIPAGVQREVTYTNLSPGTYTFSVSATNSDGVSCRTYDSIVIVISPPWWKTGWAYTVYILLFAATLWLFISYRSRRLQKENRLLEQRVSERTHQLNESLSDLKATQAQLIQSEKMASLGELTAGIAHEIQNPLNFVNNFSELNAELLLEMNEEIRNCNYEEARLIAKDIEDNDKKITFHGKRAEAIVKSMLQHSRKSSGSKEPTDINALLDEYLRLSYHGMRSKDNSFVASFNTDFDEAVGKVSIVPQDMGRVFLNLFNNAFYAADQKKKMEDKNFQPTISVSTKRKDGKIEIRIADNGTGIPQNIVNKVFQPFFTTKATGEGTGLGLSLSYDIVVKEHGGTIDVVTTEREGATFIIILPERKTI